MGTFCTILFVNAVYPHFAKLFLFFHNKNEVVACFGYREIGKLNVCIWLIAIRDDDGDCQFVERPKIP